MKSVKLLFILAGLIFSMLQSMYGQSCDPQLTSVNIINRDSFCLTHSDDFVELEVHWAMSGGNPLCIAPIGSWRIQISMPPSFIYKVDDASDVVTPGPFTWTYDDVNNALRGLNNAPINIGSNGVILVNISGDGSQITSCNELSSIVNIQIVSLPDGSPANFDNIIDNDSGEFDLEVRAPMVVTALTIASCYPDLASAEAAAIAATTVVNTGGCLYPDILKVASTIGTCSAVITVTVTNECGDEQEVMYNTIIDNTDPVITCLSNQTRTTDLNVCTYTVVGTELNASATDNCPVTYTYELEGATTGTGSATLNNVMLNIGVTTITWTAADECGNTSSCQFTVTVNDNQAPSITCPGDVVLNCEDSRDPADTGFATSPFDNCPAAVVITYADVAQPPSMSCPNNFDILRTWTATDAYGNFSQCVQTLTIQDVSVPLATAPQARTLEGCSLTNIPENKVIALSPTQAVNTYYTDRYAPAGFVVENYMGGDRLKHSISAADCEGCRPGGFNTGFYNTQGRKFDTPNALSLAIDLYVPAGWASTGRRMAGLWGTGLNNVNAISSYPIIEFTSEGGTPRFRGWNNGVWIDMGLPTGFVYDSWVTLDIRLVGNELLYRVGDLTLAVPAFGTVQFTNMILQGHNAAAGGVTYDIYWDNFKSVGTKLAYSTTPVSISASQFSAELGSATDKCPGPITISYQDGTPTGCPITFVRTFTITDACGYTTQVTQDFTIEDTQAPVVAGSLTPQNIEACFAPPPVTTVAALEALPGNLTITDCNPDNELIVTSSDVLAGSCPTMVTRTYNVTDPCGMSVDIVQMITYDDTTDPQMTTPADITLEGCTEANLPQPKVIALSPTQAANTYYTDRYAPAGFVVENYMGGDRLKHSISAADCQTCRPIAYQDGFYNTQGRKYDTPNALSLAIDLYIPADWATTGRRMAGLWGTGYNNLNAISAYPIIEFASLDGDPRFRVWDNGVWVDLGLPSGFVYNSWVTLDIRLVGNTILYRVGDLNATVPGLGTVEIRNMILQGHNAPSPGVTYDIYWENFKSVGTKLPYSATPVVISSSQYSAELGSATDNCFGPIEVEYVDVLQTPTCPNVRQILRTFKVTDACGYTTEDTQTIFIQDTQAPVVTTPLNSLNGTFQCDDLSGIANALTLTPSATDACVITLNLTSDNTVPDMNCPSAYVRTRTWNFTDACNTSTTFTQTITVIDDTAPVVTCKSDMSRNTDLGVCTYTVLADEFDVTATDNCNLISYNYTLSGATMGSGMTTLSGVVFQKGETTVSWTATDECNNTSPVCSFKITVIDNQAPTVQSIPNSGAAIVGYTCGQTITINTDANSCAAGRTIVKPVWADNCAVVSSTAAANNAVTVSDFGSFISGTFPKGTTTITFTGTDAAGNMGTCTLIIQVNDVTPPIVNNCPGNISVGAPLNACSTSVTWTEPSFLDSCLGLTVVQTSSPTAGLTNGSQFPIGVTTITYTATDASDNVSVCTFTVEVTGTCNPITEFTTTFVIESSGFATGQSRTGVYTVDNIGTSPNASSVQFLITVPETSFSSGNGPMDRIPTVDTSVTLFSNTFMSNNGDWDFDISNYPFIICTLKTGKIINPGESSIIAIEFNAVAITGGTGQTTGQLFFGTAGDQNFQNNFAQSSFLIN